MWIKREKASVGVHFEREARNDFFESPESKHQTEEKGRRPVGQFLFLFFFFKIKTEPRAKFEY